MIENETNEIEEARENQSHYGLGSTFWEIVKIILTVLVIIIPIRVFLIQPFFVQGASMEPNFHDKEYLIINEMGYKTTQVGIPYKGDWMTFFTVTKFRDLKRGDVVVFKYPKNPSVYYIKRVIGLPGEHIEIKDNRVKISNSDSPDGFILDEGSYLDPAEETDGNVTLQLGESEFYVMGDNRQFSSDSRSWGTVPQAMITGKVLLRAWPVGKAEIF